MTWVTLVTWESTPHLAWSHKQSHQLDQDWVAIIIREIIQIGLTFLGDMEPTEPLIEKPLEYSGDFLVLVNLYDRLLCPSLSRWSSSILLLSSIYFF